jgi:hypothetical protein
VVVIFAGLLHVLEAEIEEIAVSLVDGRILQGKIFSYRLSPRFQKTAKLLRNFQFENKR